MTAAWQMMTSAYVRAIEGWLSSAEAELMRSSIAGGAGGAGCAKLNDGRSEAVVEAISGTAMVNGAGRLHDRLPAAVNQRHALAARGRIQQGDDGRDEAQRRYPRGAILATGWANSAHALGLCKRNATFPVSGLHWLQS